MLCNCKISWYAMLRKLFLMAAQLKISYAFLKFLRISTTLTTSYFIFFNEAKSNFQVHGLFSSILVSSVGISKRRWYVFFKNYLRLNSSRDRFCPPLIYCSNQTRVGHLDVAIPGDKDDAPDEVLDKKVTRIYISMCCQRSCCF